ncbi:hypothetical protein MLD38_010176 [Melastoma candidum]|uniref:Uncharacterized protein n=1 Tax=Melastoma candidum TaxID=119954 RepID=A0ACB9QZ57_9MYRT|nr:hypothetical protein MLD38_010176 [Melastoma candidum]
MEMIVIKGAKLVPVQQQLFISIFLLFAGTTVTHYDGTLVSRICNPHVISFADELYDLAPNLVENLVDRTPKHVGLLFRFQIRGKDIFGNIHGPLYGVGYCSASLTPNDCSDCLVSAKTKLYEECSLHGIGAQVHLKDCDIRYENYNITDVK